jgi:hypothetical protein
VDDILAAIEDFAPMAPPFQPQAVKDASELK